MSATTSSAEPPSSTWMKLACLAETSAVPDDALEPGGVDEATGGVARRVREHRPGVRAAGLVRPAPPDDLGQRGLPVAVRTVGQPQLGGQHQVVHGQVRTAVAESEGIGGHPLILAVAEIEDVDPPQRRRHVGAVATGVHAHRPADGAGDAHGPLETGQTGGDGAAGHDGKAGRSTGDHDGPLGLDVGELLPERHGEPGETGIGDEEVGPAADHQDRHALTGGLPDHLELAPIDVLDQQRRRASDAIGGESPQRRVPPCPCTQRLGHHGQRRDGRHHRHRGALIRTPARGRPGGRARRRARR